MSHRRRKIISKTTKKGPGRSQRDFNYLDLRRFFFFFDPSTSLNRKYAGREKTNESQTITPSVGSKSEGQGTLI